VDKAGGAMMNRPMMTRIVGVFWAVLGVFLTFKAYTSLILGFHHGLAVKLRLKPTSKSLAPSK
jgi:hypothetical protein